MITIIAKQNSSSEWQAAVRFRELVSADFPHLMASQSQILYIVPSVKTPWNPDVKDVDLYVFGRFDPPLQFRGRDGQVHRCFSLSLSIEVKSHSSEDVEIEGDAVWVRYSDVFHSATEQSFKQVFAIKGYFERKGFSEAPYVRNFVWLNKINREEFPDQAKLPDDLILADSSFQHILAATQELGNKRDSDLAMLRTTFDLAAARDLFAHVLTPTKLDRKKVENLSNNLFKHRLLEKLGSGQISFRGYGGAGKTAILLRAAKDLYERGSRAIILTYNAALTTDLYRQLMWLNLDQNAFGRSVSVETLHSFFIRWLVELVEIESADVSQEWLNTSYRDALRSATYKLRTNMTTPADVVAVKRDKPARFAYDYVLIDEAQDCFDEERDFLYSLYDSKKMVLNFGHRQLIRSDSPCSWIPNDGSPTHEASLSKCLRLKPNIAQFVTSLSKVLGDDDFEIDSDNRLSGGQIFVILGELSERRAFVEELITSNKAAGNDNVDMLFCVPGVDVRKLSNGRVSKLGEAFTKWNLEIYDAVEREVRIGLPSSVDSLRITTYESARGLEGWCVLLDGLDIFYDQKLTENHFSDLPEILRQNLSRKRALEWILIPLTRGIDTLVIGIRDPASQVGAAIIATAVMHPDFIKIVARS